MTISAKNKEEKKMTKLLFENGKKESALHGIARQTRKALQLK